MQSRTEQILNFLKEIDKAKFVERQIYLSNGRKENDAEHSWHTAMFLLLFEKELPKIDMAKALKLILSHDLVEIYAGDTFAFDNEGKKTKKEREMKAAEKLFSLLPDDLKKEYMDLFLEFEDAKTAEAKFALSFDKLHATFQNVCNDCKALRVNNVSFKELDDYIKDHVKHDPFIFELYKNLTGKAERILRN